jgi:DNA-directed RNA polymerase subunit F
MAEFTVLDENPISLAHLKDKLEELETEAPLTFRGEKTKAYLENFTISDVKETEIVIKNIEELSIPRLKQRHITKIVDIMPKDLDSLKIIFSGEIITISDDDLKKILDVIPQ